GGRVEAAQRIGVRERRGLRGEPYGGAQQDEGSEGLAFHIVQKRYAAPWSCADAPGARSLGTIRHASRQRQKEGSDDSGEDPPAAVPGSRPVQDVRRGG